MEGYNINTRTVSTKVDLSYGNCRGITKIITRFFSSHKVFGERADILQKSISQQIQLYLGRL